ncbi:hypothetical protein A8926_6409 [Saccharopolyspora spinosa]|uniref:Uncharacterized protein n=1 Tax=Saccharopolyspora spinosa TaxID=60894 RepID=A0A2N3Y5Z5_SACSN|nr:hypothetical protein A8926_6409 [Saccharopolyspora spinosa]
MADLSAVSGPPGPAVPPDQTPEGIGVRWFRYKHGVVGESKRVLHCAEESRDGTVTSVSGEKFRRVLVEECEEGEGAACVPCLLVVISRADRPADMPPVVSQVPADTLAVMLAEAQWAISDAQFNIVRGDYPLANQVVLADKLRRLSHVLHVRAHAMRSDGGTG